MLLQGNLLYTGINKHMSEVTNEQIVAALAAKKEEIIKKFLNDSEIVMSIEDHWSFDHICVVLDHSIKILSTPLDTVTELSPVDFANTSDQETESSTVEGYDENEVVEFSTEEVPVAHSDTDSTDTEEEEVPVAHSDTDSTDVEDVPQTNTD